MATRLSVNLEPAKGTTSYIVSSSSTSAKPKIKPAPIDTSRAQTMPSDKDKNPPTPRGTRHGHRRVDETGETTYKKTPSSALMSAIQLGIGFTVGRLSAKPDRDVLMQDFAEVETVSFPSEGTRETPSHRFSDFKFKSYSPMAFRYFRDLFGMNPAEFMMALCNEHLVELTNSGASGSLFYVTNDDEFIVKTVQHKEAEFLQKLLPGYYLNLNQNKRTLLPKFFGLYCYQCGGKNIRLVVMNNLLPLEYKIQLKYDLKGSTYKRKASKGERAKGTPTLKDLDFINDHPEGLFLEQDTYNAVIKTIQRDCRVLQSFKIMDYSLLLAIHKVDELERDRPSLGDITAGVKPETPSGHLPPSPGDNHRTTSHVPQETTTEGTSLPTRPPLTRSRSLKGREGFSSAWEAITVEDRTEERPVGGIPARNAKGERLLLFLGIIDILQSYRIVKKLEHGWKALVHDGDTVSVHRPSFYANRFQEFMTNHVFKKQPVKEKNSPRKRNPERGLNRVRSMTEHDRTRADSGERGRSRSFTESDKPVPDVTRVKRAATIATDHGTTSADKKVTVLDPKGGSSPGAEESDSAGTESPPTVTQETVSKDTDYDYEKTNLSGTSEVPQEITESALGTDTAEQPVSTAPIEQENTSNEVAIENEASDSDVIRPTSDNPSVDNLKLIENIMDMESGFREEAT